MIRVDDHNSRLASQKETIDSKFTFADCSVSNKTYIDIDRCVDFFNSCDNSKGSIATPGDVDCDHTSLLQNVRRVELGNDSIIDGNIIRTQPASCSNSTPLLRDFPVSGPLDLEPSLLLEQHDNHFTLEEMLSPPSSCEDEVECESLFPELTNFDTDNNSESSENNFEYSYMLNTQDSLAGLGTVVAITSSKSDVKTEPFVHPYYSQQSRPPTKLGRPPKYAQLEPPTGYAVSGHLSKNAVLARENRRKKKEYVTSLEDQVSQLSSEKTVLSNELDTAKATINSLREEIDYLRSVIANETTIGKLLDHIPNSTDLTIKRGNGKRSSTALSTVPVVQNNTKRVKSDHDYTASNKISGSSAKPGVCLHVAAGVVSLEFCKKCNANSTSSSI